MIKLVLTSVSVAFLAGAPASAVTVATEWISPAGACVPTGNTVRESPYYADLFSVSIPYYSPRPVRLMCPITTPLRSSNTFEFSYWDASAKDPAQTLMATLYRITKTTGVRTAIVSISSDDFTEDEYVSQQVPIPLAHRDYDFDRFSYAVQIDLKKTGTNPKGWVAFAISTRLFHTVQ